VQQAYISAYYKLDSYASTGSFGAWLTRITINESLMIKRKPDNRVADSKNVIDYDNIIQTDGKPDAILANKELAVLIETAVEKLPEDYRSVFVLRAIQQLSIKETADSLGIYEATVKTRFHRARNLMQQSLNQHIEQANMQVYEFAGQRCDHIVNSVLKRLAVIPTEEL
jgi:RNA polymerase sigma-70 factor (ECF subfamily)